MAGKAQRVIEEFWRIQDEGDYTRLAPLFADDALLEDPVWGTHKGRDAILGFMTTMVKEMGARKSTLPSMKFAAMIMRSGHVGPCIRRRDHVVAWAYTRSQMANLHTTATIWTRRSKSPARAHDRAGDCSR